MKDEKKKKKGERAGEQKQAKKKKEKGGQGTRLNEFSLIFYFSRASSSFSRLRRRREIGLSSLTQLPPTAVAA